MMTKYIGPSPKQAEILMLIVEYFKRNMYQPDYRELAAMLGITKHAVFCRLEGLRKKGYIEKTGQARSVFITNKGIAFLDTEQ